MTHTEQTQPRDLDELNRDVQGAALDVQVRAEAEQARVKGELIPSTNIATVACEEMGALTHRVDRHVQNLIKEQIGALEAQAAAYSAMAESIIAATVHFATSVEQSAEVASIVLPRIREHTATVEHGPTPLPPPKPKQVNSGKRRSMNGEGTDAQN